MKRSPLLTFLILVSLCSTSFSQNYVGSWNLLTASYNGINLSGATGYLNLGNNGKYTAKYDDGSDKAYAEANYSMIGTTFKTGIDGKNLAINGMTYTTGPNGYYTSISCDRNNFVNYVGPAIGYDQPKIEINGNTLTLKSQSGKAVFTYEKEQSLDPPVADFTASPTSGILPLSVQFTDNSIGDVTTWNWDFGDGNSSSEKNPSHTYQTAGIYTVELTVTGSTGSNTKTRTNYISVSGQSVPVANFTGSPTSGTAPLTVQFTDQSTGNITSRLWDFGDGKTSSLQNPVHLYQNPGNYTVKLQVSGFGGSQTKIENEYISVYTQPNLLSNGNFSAGVVPWQINIQGSAAASGAVNNGEYAITITNSGQEDWHIQFSQVDLKIRKGGTYQVAFEAYAAGSRNIKTHIGMNADPWTAYSAYELFSLTTQKQKFTFTFTMNHSTDLKARLVFDLGKSSKNVYLDNIVLYQLSDLVPVSSQIESFDLLPDLNHWGINTNSFITTGISNSKYEGTGALIFDWQVQAFESWGGATGFWIWNPTVSNVWNLTGYEYLSFWYYVSKPSSAPGHVQLEIEMWEVSNAPINTEDGGVVEKWNTHQRILDDSPGWKEVKIPLVVSDTKSPNGFWLADWSPIKGNNRLDLNKIRGFYFGTNVDQTLYQANPDIARGTILIDHLNVAKTPMSVFNEPEAIIPENFNLQQNYPNPFNPKTKISYSLNKDSFVKVQIFNLKGELIEELYNGFKPAGHYILEWDASDAASGTYLIKMESDGQVNVRKCMLLK